MFRGFRVEGLGLRFRVSGLGDLYQGVLEWFGVQGLWCLGAFWVDGVFSWFCISVGLQQVVQ